MPPQAEYARQPESEALQRFTALEADRFSGHSAFTINKGRVFDFYWHQGHLVWLNDSNDLAGNWQQPLHQACPHLSPKQLSLLQRDHANAIDQVLTALLSRRLILRSQATQFIKCRLVEAIFEILAAQASAVDDRVKPAVELDVTPLKSPPTNSASLTAIPSQSRQFVFTTHQICTLALATWQTWQQAGLTQHSPQTFPSLMKDVNLAQQPLSETQQQLISRINGKRSLWQLAYICKQPLAEVAIAVLSLAKAGLIQLSDTPVSTEIHNNRPNRIGSNQARTLEARNQIQDNVKPRVIAVDDSLAVLKQLGQIFEQQHWEFIGLQDPLKAIVTLLKLQPDLIILDVVMPTINGYEVCKKIRKIPHLAATPIIILTSKKEMKDRAQAKFVGATRMLVKPLEAEQMVEIARQYRNQTASVKQSVA